MTPNTRLVLMLPPSRLPKWIHLELSGNLRTWWMAKRFVSCRKKVQKQLWGRWKLCQALCFQMKKVNKWSDCVLTVVTIDSSGVWMKSSGWPGSFFPAEKNDTNIIHPTTRLRNPELKIMWCRSHWWDDGQWSQHLMSTSSCWELSCACVIEGVV